MKDHVHPSPELNPEDLGGGVWSIPVPIPDNPLGYTLVYLLETEGGPVLVDAGWDDPASWDALTAGLAAAGTSVRDIYGVLVTHFHSDHSGLAGRVREASGAWMAMHTADAELVRGFAAAVRGDGTAQVRSWELDLLARAGASEADVEAMRRTPRWSVHPPPVPDRELADGQLADVPGRRLRVLHTPGHSPGHVCLHLEEEGRLFTGDHVLPRITPHVSLHPFDGPDADPLGDFLASLDRVANLPADHVLPAHKHRFSGLADRIGTILAHHEGRLAELVAAVSSGPRTLWQIAQRIGWSRGWEEMPPSLRRMALGETAAHLRRLERMGRVESVSGAEPVRFVVTGQ
ncbi:MAG: MBL fold metallo-hydrolase [Streptosporangiales bacterium]|nr:MBL fold metallo-hydrolase [Streptosporangiales bacterium]